ncbi:MAG: hypothetical protein KAQ98_11775 [Bacteriovoracaceae bacterium]|nr:hypothetical protein [Bacteriovoracaceae bacterium]
MKMVNLIVCIFVLSLSQVFAVDSIGVFSGRLVKINTSARLIRLKVDFSNIKYLNKGDKLEFWNEKDQKKSCRAFLMAKSNEYLLVRITDFSDCIKKIFLVAGGYVQIYSPDLVNNIKMGKELFKILEKKRLAVGGRLSRAKKELSRHIAKVEAVNDRYAILREKLESEWQEEITLLEEDRLNFFKQYSQLQLSLLEIERKTERYRIDDDNLKEDRWSLDSKLYFKK